jgi:hypothetical protein
VWVRFPSPAPKSVCRDNARVAQLVERTLGKGEVSSSNLLLGSRFVGGVEDRCAGFNDI